MAVSSLREQLLEREHALETLGAAWAAAVGGSGRLVLVAGEAGGGKTAVVRSFCAELDAAVLLGACDPLFTPRPLGPFLDLVDDAGDAHEVVAALVRSSPQPAVLVLEDVHWADEATLDALRLLARKVEGASLLVVATYRDDELDRLHPLRIVLGELATVSSLDRISIPQLSPAAVAELARGSAVDAEELHRVTGGNAFFVTEALAASDGELPATVRDAVLARVARLDAGARALLEAVAIMPPRAESWLLDAVARESTDSLDACVASGMLVAGVDSVEFRHELGRLAVLESIQPVRALAFHRLALAALAEPPHGEPDAARLAHHAEAAGERDAVLRFGVAAAERATKVGAHREAAAQYGRVLRFATGFTATERAELFERQSEAFYLTDLQVDAIDTLQQAVTLRREAGDVRGEAKALSQLVPYLSCRGRLEDAEAAAHGAVALLEELPASPELASAVHAVARHYLTMDDLPGAIDWGTRAVALADRFSDPVERISAATTLATAEVFRDGPEGRAPLEAALASAERHGDAAGAVRAVHNVALACEHVRAHELGRRWIEDGLARCEDNDLDLWRLALLQLRGRLELNEGRWTEAAATAQVLIEDPRESPEPLVQAWIVRALVRARRGDPGVHEALAAAAAVEGSSLDVYRLGTIAAATAEIAWLEGRTEGVREATDEAYALAVERDVAWLVGELALWRRCAGVVEAVPAAATGPYALQLHGDWRGAAERWEALGSPYETAVAFADADDEDALRQGLELARALEARPLATMIARRLRERGVRGVPRGPRTSTAANAAALTGREVEVLQLLAAGLRNAAIAERLFLSPRTVDHHVSAILRKLEVGSRGEAVAAGRRLGLLEAI